MMRKRSWTIINKRQLVHWLLKDGESQNRQLGRGSAACFLTNYVTVQSQPPKCYAFRRCGVSAK